MLDHASIYALHAVGVLGRMEYKGGHGNSAGGVIRPPERMNSISTFLEESIARIVDRMLELNR
jgi:hypothetical protein